MSNVRLIRQQIDDVDQMKARLEQLAAHGGGGDNGGMDGRLAHLEKRVDSIDGRLDRIEGDVATLKQDMSEVKVAIASLDAKLDIGSIRASIEKSHTDIYKWVATLALSLIGVGAAFYFGMQRLAPPAHQQQPTQQTPIIINVPSPVAAPAPATGGTPVPLADLPDEPRPK